MVDYKIQKLDCYTYAQDVLNGNIVAGELVKLACKRFVNDLERDDLEFRYEIGDKFVQFCGLVKHFKGNTTGKPFVLERWQKFIVYNLLCFYYTDTNNRRFTKALINISRKQGKSALASIICLWFLLCDGEGSPECDLSANSANQAMVAFEFVENFARQLDPRQKTIKRYRRQLTTSFNSGKLNVFASDSTKLDGFNASFFLVDEAGAARDTKMYDVLRSSQGQRTNPLGMIISTAGFDLTSPFFKMCKVGAEVMRGIKEEDNGFYMIFQLDEDDDWTDENVWEKVMPNLGVTVEKKFVHEEVNNAKNNSEAEVSILTKTFNKWCSTSTTWISNDFIQKCISPVKWSDFDENTFCYVGVDLAATGDLTSLTFLFKNEDDEKLYLKHLYYLPEYTLNHSPNKMKYRQWVKRGELIITPGNVTDYDYILADLKKHTEPYCTQKIGYDPWNATQFVINATNEGLPMYPVSQSISNLTKPTKTLERLIKMGKVVFDNNEITTWCFENSSPKYDWNDNIKIIKGGSKEQKIDGVISSIMALSVYLDFTCVNVGCTAL